MSEVKLFISPVDPVAHHWDENTLHARQVETSMWTEKVGELGSLCPGWRGRTLIKTPEAGNRKVTKEKVDERE